MATQQILPSPTLNFIVLTSPLQQTIGPQPLLSAIPGHLVSAQLSKPASASPPLKPAKRLREEKEEILRCKRRINFGTLSSVLQRPRSANQNRRNERERNRVKLINHTFGSLCQMLPGACDKPKKQKISKVDTLRGAIEYIQDLQGLLEDEDAVNAAFSSGCLPDNMENSQGLAIPVASPGGSSGQVNSPGSVGSIDAASDGPLSPEEQELLDFHSWFQ